MHTIVNVQFYIKLKVQYISEVDVMLNTLTAKYCKKKKNCYPVKCGNLQLLL